MFMIKHYFLSSLLCLTFLAFMSKKAFSQYCLPSFTQACIGPGVADFIDNFSTTGGVTNITNNGTGCGGSAPNNHTYFSSMTVSQVQGLSFNVSMQSGPLYAQGFRIWIDYNNDLDFDDPGEDVFFSTSSNAVQTGTITIPLTTSPGTKRMRVLCRFATTPALTDYCGTGFAFGECEDYNLDVIASTPCTGTPTAGTAVASATNPCPGVNVSVGLTGSSLTGGLAYQWLRGVNCTGPWIPISGLTNPSALTPTLSFVSSPGTFGYRCRITCTNSGLSDTSTAACMAVFPFSCNSNCFGASTATSSSDQDIFNVTLGTLNNTTDCLNPLVGSQGIGVGTASMYADFGGPGGVPAPVVYKGLTQPFSLTIGTCAGNVASSVKVYIDFNQNTSFGDPGEEVYSNAAVTSVSPSAVLTGSFVTPSTALTGCTKMRVVMQSTWIGIVNPTGSYGFGETEDYIIDIIQPSPHDPAISAITVPAGTCFSNNETVTATLCNYGSLPINTAANNVTVTLHVNGPSGVVNYTSVVGLGVLGPYGATCLPVTFTGVDLFAGGSYSINTSLTIGGLTNGNLINDSLGTPILRSNYRPSGSSYNLCQGSSIPFGQGLTVSGCATPISDSITVTFTLASTTNIPCTPSSTAYTGACLLGTTTIPSLPPGSTLTSGVLTATNLATTNGGWANETRMPLFSGTTPVTATNILYPSIQGNPSLTTANYTWLNNLNQPQITNVVNGAFLSGGTLNIGYHSTWAGNATSHGMLLNAGGNPTQITLKIRYTYVPASFEWYNVPVGGSILYLYSPYNPVGAPGSGITNTNTPGITTFYAACAGSSDCRLPVDLVINPTPVVVQDTLNTCEYAIGSYAGVFNLTTLNGPVSAFVPGTTTTYWGDQALFVPVVDPLNDTNSTNFIYSKVTIDSTGCFSSDSVYLDVSPIPQFSQSVYSDFVCAPNSIDISSVVSVFSLVQVDTLFFEDPLFTIPYSGNPHIITTVDTVYLIAQTNTPAACSDTSVAYIDVLAATNEIANQAFGNYSICGSVPCGNITLSDGNTETLFTTTDCKKIATITDSLDLVSLGSTTICEDIECSIMTHNGQPYVARVYEITPTTNGKATVCLYYLDQDFQDYNASAFPSWPIMDPNFNLCITQIDGGALGMPGTTAISIPNSSITSTFDPLTSVWTVCFPVDSFSTFICHTCNPGNAPLPVSLTSFTATKGEDVTHLEWRTATEINNAHFVVERSKDARNFTALSSKIVTKAPGGTSHSPLTYNYTDAQPLEGYNYYRLQQVDLDGHASYSGTVSVYFGNETMVSLYPNPVSDELHVDINTPKATNATLSVLDATGRVVRKVDMSLAAGANATTVDLKGLADGVYMIRISNAKGLNFAQSVHKK
jgi:hypothetical protein